MATIGHGVAVNLGLDIDDLLRRTLEPGDVNLDIKVADAIPSVS